MRDDLSLPPTGREEMSEEVSRNGALEALMSMSTQRTIPTRGSVWLLDDGRRVEVTHVGMTLSGHDRLELHVWNRRRGGRRSVIMHAENFAKRATYLGERGSVSMFGR